MREKTVNGRIVSGYFALALGFIMILFNAYEYVFGDGEGEPSLLIIGLMLVVVGTMLSRRT